MTARRASAPFGPSDVDPDDVRDEACSLTTPSRVCSPGEPERNDTVDLPDVAVDPSGGALFGNLIVIVLVALIVLAIAWIIWYWFAGSTRNAQESSEPDVDLDEAIDGVLAGRVVDDDSPPARWRRRAEEHAAAGEFRDAVRCRYRALVGDLARAGYVDEIPGRTSGEERGQVRDTVGALGSLGATEASAVTDSFDVAADAFDSAWFDTGAVTADDLTRFTTAENVVLGALERGPGRRLAGRGVR